jgi:hypothetical protein
LADSHTEEWATCFHLKRQGSLEIVIRFTAAVPATLNAQVLDYREDIITQDLEGRVQSIENIV